MSKNTQVKRFKSFVSENKIEDEDLLNNFNNFDKFRNSLINHDLYEDCDLIAVYVEDHFVEKENGNYIKSYKPLTNIMKITPDRKSFSNVNGMKFRGIIQNSNGLMVLQWIDKDVSDLMIDSIKKGDDESDFYIKTLVDHFKSNR